MKTKGVALIQVLLIIAILSIFMLFMSNRAKQNLNLASVAQDRVAAQIQLHSIEAELLFELLIQNRVELEGSIKPVSDWNLYSIPFNFNGSKVSIQDHAGMLNLRTLNYPLLIQLLQYDGVSEQNAIQIADLITDWQDKDLEPRLFGFESEHDNRNARMPDLSELKKIYNFSPKTLLLLNNNISPYFAGRFNPLNASDTLLTAFLGQDIAKLIIDLRNANDLNAKQFSDISGLSQVGEGIGLFTSNYFTLLIETPLGLKKEFVVSLKPIYKRGSSPINYIVKTE